MPDLGIFLISRISTLVALAQSATDPWDMSGVQSEEIKILAEKTLSLQDIDWFAHFSAHWHNRLVHIPMVVLGVAAFVGLLQFRVDSQENLEQHWRLTQNMVLASALLAWVAVLTGQNQAGNMPQEMVGITQWHQVLGMLTAFSISGHVWWATNSTPTLHRRWQVMGLWGLLILMLITGALGSVLAASGH